MINILNISKLFNTKLKTGSQKIKLSKIKIKNHFKLPKVEKFTNKYKYFRNKKKLVEKIVVTKDKYLIDGYTSYLLAKMFGLEIVDVEVIDCRI